MSTQPVAPWYRHRWPWILMSGPAVVVVAGIVTTVIAVRTSDGVVADDYYKQGLAINRVMERDSRAQSLHVGAKVMFNEERTKVRVLLASAAAMPASLRLTLIHPTRKGEDQAVVLQNTGGAMYEGGLRAPALSKLRIAIEDGAGAWRLTGRWDTSEPAISIGAAD